MHYFEGLMKAVLKDILNILLLDRDPYVLNEILIKIKYFPYHFPWSGLGYLQREVTSCQSQWYDFPLQRILLIRNTNEEWYRVYLLYLNLSRQWMDENFLCEVVALAKFALCILMLERFFAQSRFSENNIRISPSMADLLPNLLGGTYSSILVKNLQ